jgi:hypothetical protein
MTFYILFGIGFLGFGIFQFLKTRKLVKNGITMTAKVTDILQKESQSQDEDGYTTTSYSYYPVYEFTTKDGETHTVESKNGFAFKNKFKVGDSVEVIYLEEKPQDATIKKGGNLWFLPVIMIIVGVVFFVLAFTAS